MQVIGFYQNARFVGHMHAKVSIAKNDMRARAKAVRAHASAHHGNSATNALAELGLTFLDSRPPAIVSGFMPIGDEIDVTGLMARLNAEGFTLCLPVIIQKGAPLEFRVWAPGDILEEKKWGIREPGPSAKVVQPDIVLAPLLAFDKDGYRLGYGGGFYDRSLAEISMTKPVVAIGVGYDAQEVPAVPCDQFDRKLDWMLTPSGPRKFD